MYTKSSKSSGQVILQHISVQTSPLQGLRSHVWLASDDRTGRHVSGATEPKMPYCSRPTHFVHNCFVHRILQIYRSWATKLEFGLTWQKGGRKCLHHTPSSTTVYFLPSTLRTYVNEKRPCKQRSVLPKLITIMTSACSVFGVYALFLPVCTWRVKRYSKSK